MSMFDLVRCPPTNTRARARNILLYPPWINLKLNQIRGHFLVDLLYPSVFLCACHFAIIYMS